MMVAFEMLTES